MLSAFIDDESEDISIVQESYVASQLNNKKDNNENRSQTKASKTAKAPRKSRAKPKPFDSKPPGDSTYPKNAFSLTVTKTKTDVGVDSLDAVGDFIPKYAVKGAVSTEVGPRAFNLHLQGVFIMHWPTQKPAVQYLQKLIKRILPLSGTLYKVLLKPFQGNQSFQSMLGYVTKDSGREHYQIRTHNVTRQDLAFGRRDHDALLTSFDDSKKIINLKNMFNESYKFNMRCMHPAVVPIQYAILYMLQSGSYILSPDFISIHKKIDLTEANILWKMVHKPAQVVLSELMQILFNLLSYGVKVYVLIYIVIKL